MPQENREDPEAVSRLSPLRRHVTPESRAKPPYRDWYWASKEPDVHDDVIFGDPLFASVGRFDRGTGRPSVSKPVDAAAVVRARASVCPATRRGPRTGTCHLGHVLDDGPREAGRLRYRMNSAALRFIPGDDLEREGYGECRRLFQTPTG